MVETVNVKDKSGKPVEGLTAKDFTVTEDGAEQSIRFFEYQKVSDVAEAGAARFQPSAAAAAETSRRRRSRRKSPAISDTRIAAYWSCIST